MQKFRRSVIVGISQETAPLLQHRLSSFSVLITSTSSTLPSLSPEKYRNECLIPHFNSPSSSLPMTSQIGWSCLLKTRKAFFLPGRVRFIGSSDNFILCCPTSSTSLYTPPRAG